MAVTISASDMDPAIGMTVHYWDEDQVCWPAIVVSVLDDGEVFILAAFRDNRLDFLNNVERSLEMRKIMSWHWPHLDLEITTHPV